jgi:hypothetical protein
MSTIIDGSASVTINNGTVLGITSGTAVASTSGTSIDFTGIPSWVKRITVMFNQVSTSGASMLLAQIGAGSVTTSGYVSAAAYTGASTGGLTSTAGYILTAAAGAANTSAGSLVITLLGSNLWVSSSVLARQDGYASSAGGTVTLSGTLDRLRITTVNGTDTFDAGSINILYEG